MMPPILLLLLANATAQAGCIAVTGASITAGDLASQVPAFASLPPETALILAPGRGTRRMLTGPDFRGGLLGETFGVDKLGPICVERVVPPISIYTLTESLKRALPSALDASEMELLDYGPKPVLEGRPEFDWRNLQPDTVSEPAVRPALWVGKLIDEVTGRTTPIWVRIKLWTSSVACILEHELPSGATLTAADCRIEERRHPIGSTPVSDPSVLTGKIALRRLKAGSVAYASEFAAKPSVVSGQKARLAVISGATRVVLEARVSGSARIGENVMVTNPVNGHHLNARVVGEGQLEVQIQ